MKIQLAVLVLALTSQSFAFRAAPAPRAGLPTNPNPVNPGVTAPAVIPVQISAALSAVSAVSGAAGNYLAQASVDKSLVAASGKQAFVNSVLGQVEIAAKAVAKSNAKTELSKEEASRMLVEILVASANFADVPAIVSVDTTGAIGFNAQDAAKLLGSGVKSDDSLSAVHALVAGGILTGSIQARVTGIGIGEETLSLQAIRNAQKSLKTFNANQAKGDVLAARMAFDSVEKAAAVKGACRL